jgi:hypothetical protein
MVFSEQVRVVKNEENLVEDSGSYGEGGLTACDWKDKESKTINLSATKKILVQCDVYLSAVSPPLKGAGRILVDDKPLVGSGFIESDGGAKTKTIESFVELASGSHTFKFQVSVVDPGAASDQVAIRNIHIGVIDFSDTSIEDGDSGGIPIDATTESTVISKNFTTPSRKLALGAIKKLNMIVTVNGLLDGSATSLMKNTGESNEADRINWKVFVGASQKDWTERQDDYQTIHSTYAEGAYGKLLYELDPATEYTVYLKAYNGYASQKTVRGYISIVYGPWILTDTLMEPLSFSFPQGSTLYLMLEPLFRNPTKNIKLGKKRAVSFGDSTDYYSTGSGTNILSWNYTFEIVEVDDCVLVVEGYGGCISVVGVDMR